MATQQQVRDAEGQMLRAQAALQEYVERSEPVPLTLPCTCVWPKNLNAPRTNTSGFSPNFFPNCAHRLGPPNNIDYLLSKPSTVKSKDLKRSLAAPPFLTRHGKPLLG